jgi:hypothetical protein
MASPARSSSSKMLKSKLSAEQRNTKSNLPRSTRKKSLKRASRPLTSTLGLTTALAIWLITKLVRTMKRRKARKNNHQTREKIQTQRLRVPANRRTNLISTLVTTQLPRRSLRHRLALQPSTLTTS